MIEKSTFIYLLCYTMDSLKHLQDKLMELEIPTSKTLYSCFGDVIQSFDRVRVIRSLVGCFEK